MVEAQVKGPADLAGELEKGDPFRYGKDAVRVAPDISLAVALDHFKEKNPLAGLRLDGRPADVAQLGPGEGLPLAADQLVLQAPAERALGLKLLQFAEALQDTVADYRPSQLTSYLFELAKSFSEFYHQCPVLTADTETRRTGRLLLCDLTGRTIRQGLDLLGIHVVDKM